MTSAEYTATPSKLDYYLLIHDYAIPAWVCWTALTAAMMVYTLVSGVLLGHVPWSEWGIVPSVMLGWSMVWMIAGLTAGWIPPRF